MANTIKQSDQEKLSLLAALQHIAELQKQLKSGEDECVALLQQHALLRQACEKEKATVQTLRNEKVELERRCAQLDRVIFFLRERAEGAKIESINTRQEIQTMRAQLSDLETRFRLSVEEKAEANEEVERLQNQIALLRKQ